VQRGAGFGDVRDEVVKRGGPPIQWRGQTAEDAAVDRAVASLLGQDLTAAAAVQIALLNNRSLAATYEDLGVAQADLVQAGLLRNPVFDASVRFPDRAPHGPNAELSISQEFLDLLFLPARKRVAAAQFESVKWRVTAAVMNLSADVRAAWYTLAAAGQMLEMRRTVLEAAAAAAELADRMREANTLSELDRANQQAMAEQVKIDLAAAEAEEREDRERLIALLGLSGEQSQWKITQRLPDPPAEDFRPQDLEASAVRQRADLIAAQKSVIAAGATLGVTEQSRLFPSLRLGVDTERDPGGQRVTGPTVSVPIPLFDTGSAAIARQQAMLRQSQQQYEALAVQIRSDVRRLCDRMIAARQRAELYRTVLLPLRHRVTRETQLHYNAMLAGVFQLLLAKQNEVVAGREYIESLRDYWLVRTELERAVGGKLEGTPATQPMK
jgi:cobalt-zinc-cadmium efflux system outer membrane protein